MNRFQPSWCLVRFALAWAAWVSCASPDQGAAFQNSVWYAPRSEVEVLAFEGKIGGCNAGNLDGAPGDEIVAVAGDGSVLLAWIEGGAWKHGVIETLPGEAIGVRVLGTKAGFGSFVTVGKEVGDEESPGKGIAYLFSRPVATAGPLHQGWTRQTLLTDDALLHAVDSSQQGIALAGYSEKLHWFAPTPGGLVHYVIGALPGPAKGVAVDGRDIAVACATGELVAFHRPEREGEAWKHRVLWRFPAALARIDALEGRILVSSNDGGLYLYEPNLQGDILFYQSSDRLRGAVFLQGPETRLEAPWLAATAGYDGQLSVFPRFGLRGNPTHRKVDPERLHHLAGGQFALSRSGGLRPALVTCGYGGRVILAPFEASPQKAKGSAQ